MDPTEPNWQRLATPSELVAREQAKEYVENAIRQKLKEARWAGLWDYDTSFKLRVQPCSLDWDC